MKSACLLAFFMIFEVCELTHVRASVYSLDRTCSSLKIKNGRVRIRQRGRLAKFYCNAGYLLVGDKYSACAHGKWDSPLPKCVRPTCPNKTQDMPQNLLVYPSHHGGVLNFYCKAGYSLLGPTVAYCDGRKWDAHMPTCREAGTKPPKFCDFEDQDLCGWTSDLNHDFDWRRENFKTPSGAIGTGPSYDHTKGLGEDGYYMYIETTARYENDTARLISPVYEKSDDPTCFEFFYHMYGATTGTLKVYLKKASEEWLSPHKEIFSKSGNQGNKWYRGYFDLGVIDDDYQIIIEGIRGPGYVSDIAIDDVKIIDNCEYEETTTTTTEETISTDTQQPLQTVELCQDRCGEKAPASGVARYTILCDCDDECRENNRCCPDYFEVCVAGVFFNTTDENEVFNLTTVYQTETYYETTTATQTETTTDTQTPSTTTLKIVEETTEKATTARTEPDVRKNTTTSKETATTTPKNIIKKVTIPSRRRPVILESPPPPVIIEQKVLVTQPTTSTQHEPQHSTVSANDLDDDHDRASDDASYLDYDDIPEQTDPEIAKTIQNVDESSGKHLKANVQVFHVYKKEESRGVNYFIVGGSVLIVLVLVIVGIVSARRILFHKCRVFRINSANSGSLSNVRFVTHDEELNFSLEDNDL